ncbi:MAG: hypothetical protein NC205_07885 [Prevotella sp.]|nr:hypothetical protein [Alistipes senegalensis]MCM1358501.1 hypothetical protein [Prevotella sp.]
MSIAFPKIRYYFFIFPILSKTNRLPVKEVCLHDIGIIGDFVFSDGVNAETLMKKQLLGFLP